jgi:hypothetical protein
MIAISYQDQPDRDHRGYFKGYAEWNNRNEAGRLSGESSVFFMHNKVYTCELSLRNLLNIARFSCLCEEGPSYLGICIPQGVIPNETPREGFRYDQNWTGGYEEFKITPPKKDSNETGTPKDNP